MGDLINDCIGVNGKRVIPSVIMCISCKELRGWGGDRGEQLLELLHKPTAKESALVEKFKTEGGPAVREYCPNLTKDDCRR